MGDTLCRISDSEDLLRGTGDVEQDVRLGLSMRRDACAFMMTSDHPGLADTALTGPLTEMEARD